VPSMRGFSWTIIAFVVALCVSWVSRTWVLGFWLSPVLDVPSRLHASVLLQDRAALERTVTITTLLLTFPIFSAETWLLISRMTRNDQARRLTVPFSVVSAAAVLLTVWLARQVEVPHFIALF
jgi:hypothetical protein